MSVLKIKDANNQWQSIPAIKGADGIDGISPIATVSKSGDTATISITDKNGTTTATIKDGVDGTNGTNGRDGYVQYTAGDNITIENNVISTNVNVITSSDSTYTIASLVGNTSYKLSEITSLTITAVTTFDRESVIYFTSGTTPTDVSLPSSITNLGDVPTMTETSGVNSGTCTASKNYIIAIQNNIAVWKEY